MDLDIEMGDVDEGAMNVQVFEELPRADDILQSEELEEPGEVAEDELTGREAGGGDEGQTLVPSKIHIRGVDTLHTDDIKAYVKVYFGPVDKIEWIDDNSANLVFGNEFIAGEAIISLSAIEIADVTALTVGESLPAKPFDGKPAVSLQVRLALKSDKKQTGAALHSRYYLLHPEHDPEERRKKYQKNQSRFRDREGDNRRSGIRHRRASDDDVDTFDASMYDDTPCQRHARRSLSPDNSVRFHASENRGKELFANRVSKRNRSASPRRDTGSDGHMDALDRSSHQNKTHAKSIKDRIFIANSGKELFPIKATEKGGRLDQLEESIGSARLRDEDMPKIVDVSHARSDGGFNIRGLANQRGSEASGFAIKGAASANARELFPDKLGTTNAGKELLDSARSKRRQRAQDLFL
ncbi:hypothetical protein C2857_002044 [Epichloe festucae Fl1]|uniref:Uncharacterized protein n=1 Tax=Epichloe festucae (strain Fl1) TaxID=877507 RepID=A0A7U3SNA1_EPIFF|nr:hypothetical protein C2857_002044 [Epichloe festucae Fl1]